MGKKLDFMSTFALAVLEAAPRSFEMLSVAHVEDVGVDCQRARTFIAPCSHATQPKEVFQGERS